MSLPEKDYYSLPEIAERWHTKLSDVYYYATHGQIEVLAWLDVHCRSTRQKQATPLKANVVRYQAYGIIYPHDIRQIIRASTFVIGRFVSVTNQESFEISEDLPSYSLTAEDLVMSRLERNRFEMLYTLYFTACDRQPTSVPRLSFPGRPSVMHKVQQHFKERCNQGRVLSSLQREAEYLSFWAVENLTEDQSPKAKTIMNTIRNDYRHFRHQHKH